MSDKLDSESAHAAHRRHRPYYPVELPNCQGKLWKTPDFAFGFAEIHCGAMATFRLWQVFQSVHIVQRKR